MSSQKSLRESHSHRIMKTPPEKPSKYDQYNISKKIKIDNIEEMYSNRDGHSEQSTKLDGHLTQEKILQIGSQLKEFAESFREYIIHEEIKDKMNSVSALDEKDPFYIIKSLHYLLKTLIASKKEEENIKNKSLDNEYLNDYELLLQKAENDIRQHIRIEQQLKLLIETMQSKLEDYEKNKDNLSHNTKSMLREVQTDNAKLIELLKSKEQEIEGLNKIIKQKDDTIKSYEERVLTITILEHKLKNLQDKHAKEKEEMKKYYEAEFANLTKEIQHMHKSLSVNLASDEKIKVLQKELQSYKDFNIKKIQSIENRLKNFNEVSARDLQSNRQQTEEDNSDLVLKTEPDMSERRRSMRPATSQSYNVKYKPYDLSSHRHSIELQKARPVDPKSASYRAYSNNSYQKKKNEIINELNVLSISRVKELQQKQAQQNKDIAKRSSKDFDNYFKYFSGKLDALQQMSEREREQLKTSETGRRSNSVKRGSQLSGHSSLNNQKKVEKSYERHSSKENLYKTPDEAYLNSERLSYSKSSNKLKSGVVIHKTASSGKFKKIGH